MEERKEGDESTRVEILECDILNCKKEAEWSHIAEGMVIKLCNEHEKGYKVQTILHNLEYNPTALSVEELMDVFKPDILHKLLDQYAMAYEAQLRKERELRKAVEEAKEEEEDE